MFTSPGCCAVPPVDADYEPKGKKDVQIAGLSCYVVGPEDAKRAIVAIYDVFGFWTTTLQGADMIAHSTKMKVIVPDLFRGKPLGAGIFPLDSQEKVDRLNQFMAEEGNPEKRAEDLRAIAKALRKQGVTALGVYGLCWGSKPATLACGKESLYNAMAQLHPSLLEAKDALELTVPLASFTSQEESPEKMQPFYKNLNANEAIAPLCSEHHYGDMPHGFAGSRANLKDEANVRAFTDVYQRTADFFVRRLKDPHLGMEVQRSL